MTRTASSETPVAWLWQNTDVLGDGRYDFYPTAARAAAEMARLGGWATPVYARGEQVQHRELPAGADIFLDLFDWSAGRPRLNVSIGRAMQIKAHMLAHAAEDVDA